RSRLDPRDVPRRLDRRRLLAWPQASRGRRTMDLSSHWRAHHRRGGHRPVDQKGVCLMKPILSARGLNKRYGRVTALDNCDFDLMPGEILAVIVDNGAGKSSLIKALSGAIKPDSGDIYLYDQKIELSSPN